MLCACFTLTGIVCGKMSDNIESGFIEVVYIGECFIVCMIQQCVCRWEGSDKHFGGIRQASISRRYERSLQIKYSVNWLERSKWSNITHEIYFRWQYHFQGQIILLPFKVRLFESQKYGNKLLPSMAVLEGRYFSADQGTWWRIRFKQDCINAIVLLFWHVLFCNLFDN